MIGYAEREIHETRRRSLYDQAAYLVDFYIPTWWWKPEGGVWGAGWAEECGELRCHELARAVGKVLDLEFIDGRYGHVDHTWLLTPAEWATRRDSARPRAILDVYAPGRIPMVALIDPYFALPEGAAYQPGGARTDIHQDLVDALVAQMMLAPPNKRERPR